MGLLRSSKDVIECWFFDQKKDARADNLDNAKGYVKVVDGVHKEEWGNTKLKWSYLKSKTTTGLQANLNAATL